jgi:hypothetical protein
MALAVLRRQEVGPPPGARVDWANPLAVGLRECWVARGGWRVENHGLSGPRVGTPTGTVSTGGGPVGPAISLPGTSGNFVDLGTYGPLGMANANVFTIFAVAQTNAATTRQTIYGSNNVAGAMALEINGTFTESPAAGAFGTMKSGNFVVYSGSGILTDTAWHSFAAARTAPDINGHLWFDGRRTADVITNPAGVNFSDVSANRFLGQRTAASQLWNGQIACVYIWDRVLSDVEVLQLHRDPYRFLRFERAPIGQAVAAPQTAAPVADVADAAWLNSAGNATDLYSYVDETTASDADYIESSDSPTSADEVKLRLAALDDPQVGTGHVLRYRYLKDTTGGDQIDLTAKLYRADGTTLVASQTHTNIDAVTDGTLTLTGTEADSIPTGDYASGLIVGFSAVKP